VLRRDLYEPILVWDTTTVPNGTYFVRVLASDLPSNAEGLALAGEMTSEAFEIDNTPPVLTVDAVRTAGGRTVVALIVRDDHSALRRVEYSQDGLQWRPVFPQDGMADSKTERYEVVVEGALGPRGLSIRATDAMNNLGSTQVDTPAAR
jgi:hypothetical protein